MSSTVVSDFEEDDLGLERLTVSFKDDFTSNHGATPRCNVDIITVILRNFSLKNRDGGTLLNVALTCQMFCEPALDALWREMDRVLPLFNLLPHNARWKFEFSSATEIDWAKFRGYGNRVRSFTGNSEAGATISEVSYTCLLFLNKRPLFPKLRQLNIGHTGMPLSLLYLLISTTLDTVVLPDGDNELHTVGHFLDALSKSVPTLRTLEFQPFSALDSSIIRFTPRFRNLRSLRIQEPGCTELLPHISSLAHLVDLEMLLSSFEFPEDAKSGFTSLETLLLKGCPPSIKTFLDAVNIESLVTLKLNMYSLKFSPGDFWDAVSNFVARGPALLRNIDVQAVGASSRGSLYHALRPFFSLQHMEQICFKGFKHLDLNDKSVETISSSWPRLRELTIRAMVGKFSFAALQTLSHRSLHLESLSLPLDTSGLCMDHALPVVNNPHRLRTFDIQDSTLDSPLADVIVHIHCVFPLISKFEYAPSVANSWNQVGGLLKAFQRLG